MTLKLFQTRVNNFIKNEAEEENKWREFVKIL